MSDLTAQIAAGWNFDNSYARLPTLLFSTFAPTPVRAPLLAVLNEPLAASLGLNSHALQSDEGIAVLAGNRIPAGAEPLAEAYAGHQFGHFTKLGDGRALLLGEQVTPQGERVDIQLKGSGRTPYSRGGDGRAALGPMLREYIISEAMHALGIPTARSLAVVTTGEAVLRETELPGAVLTRVAASHLRVGTFQYASAWGTAEEVRALADYTLRRHFPYIGAEVGPARGGDGNSGGAGNGEGDETGYGDKNGVRNSGENGVDKTSENSIGNSIGNSVESSVEKGDRGNRYLLLLQEVVKRQARLIAQWQRVGFVHGVMNTDNMALSGETIDYGPCAFMDTYDPATVFSSIDVYGRYAYGNQPPIAAWNLARLAETLLPLLDADEERALGLAKGAIEDFTRLYRSHWLAGMRAKLGVFGVEEGDEALAEAFLDLMHKYEADYTNTFLALTFDKLEGAVLFESEEFAEWHRAWQARLKRQERPWAASHELMRASNPAVIPRNHRVEEALTAAVDRGDYSVMERLLGALANPFAHSPEQAEYAALPVRSSRPYRTFCGT